MGIERKWVNGRIKKERLYIVVLIRNINMRTKERIIISKIARRELLINLRRAHCLRLLFAFSLTFDPRHYGKWQVCRISPFDANLSAKILAVNGNHAPRAFSPK